MKPRFQPFLPYILLLREDRGKPEEAMSDTSPTIFEETILINGYGCDLNGFCKPAIFFQLLTEAAHLHASPLGAGFETLATSNQTWVQWSIGATTFC